MTQQERTASREKLKLLIDELSDQELHAVGRYMCALHLSEDPVAASLAHVPVDDEPVTDADLEAIDESDEDLQYTTPPHQDFQPVRGAPDTWTAWVPYGDCDAALGGLAVAEGSGARGWLPVGADHETVMVDAQARWAWSPMTAGDVLLFHSLTVHQGVDNTSGDRIRLAGSFRYQRISDPADAGALNVHLGVLDWEQVYADWTPDDPLRYYWRPLPLRIQPPWHTVANQR